MTFDIRVQKCLTAIQNGISTSATKQRLEELETQKMETAQRICIERAKEKVRLTKRDIIKFISKGIKKEPMQMIDLLIKEVVDNFTTEKEIIMVEGAGHFPIEENALKQFETACCEFIDSLNTN